MNKTTSPENLKQSAKQSNLKKRITTACVLVFFAFWGLFTLPQISYAVVTAFIVLLAATEWPRLIGKPSAFNSMLFVCSLIFVMGLGVLGIQYTGHTGWVSFVMFILSLFLWLWLFQWMLTYEKKQRLPINNTSLNILLGLLIFAFCWLGLNIIRDFQYGSFLVLFFLLLIWGADTTAYFAGKLFGKHKITPVVSPNKTWVGVYAALIFALIAGSVAASCFPFSIQQRLSLIPLALIVTIFAIIGDLVISAFKRQFKLKDSGCILPGHGGLLDRIDSLMAGAPIFALGLMFLGLK